MRKLLSICVATLLFALITQCVQAGDTPTVQIEPITISPDGNVYIYVTAATDDTVLSDTDPIKVQRRKIVIGPAVVVFGPLIEDYWLQINHEGIPWGPIILPDAGDKICIRFPDAAIQVIDDVGVRGAPQIGAGFYAWFWTDAENPRSHPPSGYTPRDRLAGGSYLVWIGGTDGAGSFRQFYQFSVGGKRQQ